jgi:phenylalanyl-tRNA synthetase alpha chain
MFRPEMLRPMGFPEDMQVIAWGLSLERPTMIQYGVHSITELMGPKVRVDSLMGNPVPCLSK